LPVSDYEHLPIHGVDTYFITHQQYYQFQLLVKYNNPDFFTL